MWFRRSSVRDRSSTQVGESSSPFFYGLYPAASRKNRNIIPIILITLIYEFLATFFPLIFHFFLEDYHFFEKIVATTRNSAKLGLLAIKQPPIPQRRYSPSDRCPVFCTFKSYIINKKTFLQTKLALIII